MKIKNANTIMKHIATMKYIDVMKSVVTMKLSKIVIFAITLFCMFCAETVHASARTYGTGEKLYFRQYPSDWSWFGNDLGTGNHVFAYFYNGGSNAWSNEAIVYISGILQVTVPSGTWTNVIFTRQSGTTPDWSRVYDGNQSEDIPLNTLTNYIQNFRQKNTSGEGWHWVSTSSAPTADMTMMDGLTCETINVCQQSIDNGDVYSLAPILNGSKTDYDYEGDHIWLKWVSGHWMPVSNDWSNSDVLLEDVADNYYLLWTSIGKSTKRIVHLKRTDCEISCQITSFEYVLTPVNVNDSTFAIEGIVAFTQTAGDLVISYGDSVQRFASPTSPQVFSLQGLRADGTTKTLRAQFEGVGGWTADSTVTAPLPDAGVEIYDSETDDVHYSETGSTYIHNKSIVLRPSVAVTDSFAWTDPNGKVCKSSRTGGDNTFTVADYMQDTTIIMYYTEFNAPPMAESNMMGNGSYETTTSADEDVSTSAYKKTSGYKYTGVWGGVNSKYDVYDNGYGSENGLFGVTTNPHVFWHRMAHIEPKDGLYMAVFDGDNEEQIAWQASTSDNENLVLQKGTTYMFSFWVANVNNYGEMIDMGKKNNAILQFKIKYKDKDDVIHEAFLGEATDLNNDEYFDNLWHQNSATFTSDYDADDVTISVVDKNTSGMRIGNDFALDDIRFRAISVQSGTIRARERFEVKFEEPKTNPVNLQVEWVTKPACGQDTCTMRVSFRYPNITAHDIKLTLKDLNIAGTYGTLVENLTLAKTPIAGNPDSTDYVAYFTSGTYAGATYNSKVKADAAAHNFKAQLIVRDAKDIDHGGYTNATLDAIAIPALTITKADIASPSCSGTTYNLSVDVKYTAQSGTTLRYYIDDVSKATRSIDYNVTERSLANVEIFGLTADGKEHTLKVTTGHILDCIATQVFTAPKANTINSFNVEPDQPDCHVVTYTLRATWEIAKQEGGEYDALMIKVGTADPYEITITAANSSGENAYFDIPITYNVGDEHPTIIAYMKERGVSCKESASYVDPIVPRMTIGAPTFEDIECNESTFDLVVPITYTYQHGKMWAWIDDKTSEKIEITATGNCKTGGSYTGYLAESASSRTTYIVFNDVTLSGDHKVSVECDGEHSCHRTKALGTAKDFSAPVLPSVDRVFKSYSTPDCNVPYTTLTFDLKYANQPEGEIEMWVDDDKTAGHMITLASASGGYTPAAALKTLENQKITFVPADSLDTHVLHIKSGSCDETFTLPRAPFMPKVEEVSVSWSATLTCGESSTYSATVTVTSSNYRNATLCVSLNDGTPQEKNPNSGSQTFTFSGLNADGGDNTVKAWFKCAGESCNQTKAFTSPTLPLAELVTPVSIPTIAACDVPTFDLTFDLKYTYQDGELQVWVDDDKKGYTTFAASETAGVGKYLKLNKSEQTKTITLTGLPSDGGTTHKLYYKFDKSGYCNNTASPLILPTFPRSPTITDVTVSDVPAKVADCTVETYDATVTVRYQYTSGEKIMIGYTDKDGVNKTHGPIALTGSPQAIVMDDLLNDIGKGSKTLEVYFRSGSEDLVCKHNGTYTAPSNSSINSGYDVTVTNTSSCGERKYNLSGTITYAGEATGDINLSFAGVRDTTISQAHCNPAGTPFTMTGLTAAAVNQVLTASFSNQPSCTAASDPFDAPNVCGFDAPVANMSYSAPACGEITTTLIFDLNYIYQSGSKLQVWVDEGTKYDVAFETDANNEKSITDIEIPGISADGAVHILHVEFVDGRCPAKTFMTPVAPFNPKPTVEINSISNQCDYESSTIVTYTTTYATTYNYYIVGKTELLATAKTASTSGAFTLNISTLDAGTYTLKMVANSVGCVSDTVSKAFTVYPKPEVQITGIENQCDYKTETTVEYTTSAATTYNYYIVGKTELLATAKTASTSGSFTLDISNLDAGTYTLKMVANSDYCVSDTVSETLTVYPKPEVNITGIENRCDNETEATVTYTTTGATTYNYYIVGQTSLLTTAETASASGSFTLDISSLNVGTYTLKMVANSNDCKSDTTEKTFEIYPLPTFTFTTAVAHDCYPSTSISVGYTSANAKTYSYTLTKEGAGSPARTVNDQIAANEGTIVLNTAGLLAGTYKLEVTAKSEHNCELAAPVTKDVTIYDQPTVAITSVENHCEGSAEITVNYTSANASAYTYEVVGTTLSGNGDAEPSGSFKIDISSLEDGDYTLSMHVTAAHAPLTCDGTTDEESFTIWAVPEVSFDTPAPIKEGVANVMVTLELEKAETYEWRFIDKEGSTELESGTDVSASTMTITLTTGSLTEGTYTLYVTPKTSHCTGEEKEVHVVVNNKPTINFTNPEIVCAGTSSLSVEYSTSPDATDLYYTIKKGSETVVAEQHVDLAAATSPLVVDISSLPYGTYTLTGYVSSALESGDNSSVDFTLLAVPTINKVTQEVTFIGCDETYSAEIKVNIFNAAGRNIYAKYIDGGEHTTHVETSVGDATATLTLNGLTHTDLSGKHEVKVYVDGFEDCGIIVGYDEPKLMTITEGFEVKPLPKSCGEEKVSLTGKVVANCSDRKIVVEYDDTYKDVIDASTSGSDFTIADIPAGGSVTKLKAYFQGNTCGVVESAEFVEPTKPEASIAFTPYVTPLCDVTTFNLEFTLDYTYQEEGTLTVWVDNDHKNTYNSADNKYAVLAASTQLNGTIEGLPADGRTGQKLYFEFSGAHSCSGSIDLPVFPQTPLITGVSVTNVPLYIEGLEGTYSPTITVTYQKAVGERIVLEYSDKNDQSQLAYSTTAVSGDGSYEFTGLSFDDVTMGSRTVHAYFEDSDCKTGGNHDGTYTAPTNSSITFESLTLVNTSTCESLRYNLTGKVSFVGAVVSDLVVEFDATHQYVIPQSQCVAGKALEFAINGVSESIPAEGKTLSAYFSLIPGNVAYSEPVYEPLVPSLDAEIVRVDTIFTCGSKSYTVFLNITSENQRGACFVYDSIAGGTLRRVAKHDGTYNGTDEFTIAMPQRVEEHYIIVRYPNTECVVRFAPISVNPYTKPQPEITLTPIERVCNTATELVLPFAITQGDIAEASLTLTDSKEQTIVSDAELTVNATKDTLTYTLPGQLSAGKHTLMVEVRDTLECVATATLPIELALDGQIYSKWNDVLLVDNSQGLYSAYQWYENGQPLSGKTDQVLYLPDGMNGTYTCLLTTAEGKLFTCEYEFEDIPRSADQQFSDNDITVLPNRVKAGGVVAVQQSQSETLRLILMSATGQRIGEYTQTDSKQLICMPAVQGVYLLRITSDSGMQTEKIVVY